MLYFFQFAQIRCKTLPLVQHGGWPQNAKLTTRYPNILKRVYLWTFQKVFLSYWQCFVTWWLKARHFREKSRSTRIIKWIHWSWPRARSNSRIVAFTNKCTKWPCSNSIKLHCWFMVSWFERSRYGQWIFPCFWNC